MIEEAEPYGSRSCTATRQSREGEHESYCLLFAGRSAGAGEGSGLGSRRLEAVSRERDGFKFREIDLT